MRKAVDDPAFEAEEDAVDDVVAPLDGLEGDGVDVLVEEERAGDAVVEPGEALGAEAEGQDLRGVVGHEAGLDVVEGAVQEGQDDEGVAEGVVRRDLVPRRHDGPQVEHDGGADGRDEVQRPAAEDVDEEGEQDVEDEALALHPAVDAQLRLRVRDAHAVHDVLEVVRDEPIAAQLAEEAQRRYEADALAVAPGLEEVDVARLPRLLVELNGRLDLRVLELHEAVVPAALAVVLDQDLERLLVAVLVHQPAGAFGHPVHEREDEDGADGLQGRGLGHNGGDDDLP